MGQRGLNPVKLPALAYEIFRAFDAEKHRLNRQKILIACSGGLDSVVLLDVLCSLQVRWNLELVVGHVHHGKSEQADFSKSRNQAEAFVSRLAKTRGLSYVLMAASEHSKLKSEADFRRFRLESIDQVVRELKIDRVALGHHADDLFETRLLRLIRGTGPSGLRAMSQISETKFRPFLKHSRARLLAHARDQKLNWVEDVSNSDPRYLRNWVRNQWLPDLNSRQKGATIALARSLDLLAESISAHPEMTAKTRAETSPTLQRSEFRALSSGEKQRLVAEFGMVFKIKDFGYAKVNEILKRLERLEVTRQRETAFQVGGLVWKIDSKTIQISKADSKTNSNG